MSIEIEVSQKGAELSSIKFNGKEKLHDGKEFWNRHAPVLFPIVGKLKNNETQINGKIYSMKQHGFARDMVFKKTDNQYEYVLESNEQTLEKFPYKFSLKINYEIKENKLITRYTVKNEDDIIMCFGIGGHPAYNYDIQNGEYYLEFEDEEPNIEYKKLEDGLVSNRKIERLNDGKIIRLAKGIFDEDAIIMKNIKSNKIYLKKENKVMLGFDFSGFPYLAIWSKPQAPFLCIEPWYNTADKVDCTSVFEEKEDILKIEPKEEFKCEYSVTFFE